MEYLNKLYFKEKSKASPFIEHWEMENHEKICFLEIMSLSSPETAIEIGSRQLGSLQFLSKYFNKTYCLDIDDLVQERIESNKLDNIDFLHGDSSHTLPKLLNKLKREDSLPSFIHIDGNHTTDGALKDIMSVVSIEPNKKTYILIHDSFNPDVRKAIKMVNYNNFEHIHFVDIDFCPGILHSREAIRDQIWGGFTLIILESSKRNLPLKVYNNFEYTYQALVKESNLYKR